MTIADFLTPSFPLTGQDLSPRLGDVCLGKVVKSNSHCDYVVQLNDAYEVAHPPRPDDYGFGSFVKLETSDRHWAVGLIYNSLLLNPQFLNQGPRLASDPDPLFTPDLMTEIRVLLGTVLIGDLQQQGGQTYGWHGIPRVVVPVNTPVTTMTDGEIQAFHRDGQGQPQFRYYGQLLCYGGNLASHLVQQVLMDLYQRQMFDDSGQRALAILGKELAWKNTLGSMG